MADDTNSEGKVVTFYSFKGGTGRTMALANVAWILASNGLKVLVVDWDLDSPGLHRYFHPFLDPAKVAATPGVIELITDYAWDATQGGDRPADWRQAVRADHAARRLPELGRSPTAACWTSCPPAARTGTTPSAVTAIDWDNFYDRLGGGQFFDALRADMKAHYDYTLIDSRTGLSDIADICTVHLPDTLVDCFTLNDQSIDGAAASPGASTQRYHYREHPGAAGPDAHRRGGEGQGGRGPGDWPGPGSAASASGMGEYERERLLGARWRSRTSRSTRSRRPSPPSATPPGRRCPCSAPTSG